MDICPRLAIIILGKAGDCKEGSSIFKKGPLARAFASERSRMMLLSLRTSNLLGVGISVGWAICLCRDWRRMSNASMFPKGRTNENVVLTATRYSIPVIRRVCPVTQLIIPDVLTRLWIWKDGYCGVSSGSPRGCRSAIPLMVSPPDHSHVKNNTLAILGPG